MKIRQGRVEEEEEEERCGEGRREEADPDKGEEREGDERRKIDVREGLTSVFVSCLEFVDPEPIETCDQPQQMAMLPLGAAQRSWKSRGTAGKLRRRVGGRFCSSSIYLVHAHYPKTQAASRLVRPMFGVSENAISYYDSKADSDYTEDGEEENPLETSTSLELEFVDDPNFKNKVNYSSSAVQIPTDIYKG
ncbi:hypothetical protein FQN60_009457, partial [Etheostoma spectabile]